MEEGREGGREGDVLICIRSASHLHGKKHPGILLLLKCLFCFFLYYSAIFDVFESRWKVDGTSIDRF